MSLNYKEIKINGKEIFLVGVIEPLAEEAKRAQEAIEELVPQVVALQISQEELEHLKIAEPEEKFYLSLEQEIYARKLAVYGEVIVPWSYLEKVLNLCQSKDIALESVDFSEEEYAKEFVKIIPPFTLVRQSLRLRKLKRKRFRAKNATDFVSQWDKAVTKLKGYKKLAQKHEEYIARKVLTLLDKKARILAFIESQRLEGVEQKLRLLLSSRQ